MFKKLKRHFVLNTVLLSSVVIAISFTIVYIAVSNSVSGRRPVEVNFHFQENAPQLNPSENTNQGSLDNQVQEVFEEKIRLDREKSLEVLLLTLIITGVSLEIVIIAASLWAAEASIKPVREAYEAQKTFISNASHELKTPLAVIQANLEAADIEGNHWLDNAMQKVEEAVELNNSLLNLARMDQIAQTPAKKSTVHLDKLVQKTADFYQPKLNERKVELKIKSTDKLEPLQLPRTELTQLLNILFDNAAKYASTYIEITVDKRKVQVQNDGATISPEKLPHIFERFYQVDKSKSGVGLGLSIAKAIADKNHWKLSASSDSKTTTFTLDLA
ncbi:HAMP domain-containing histidine kinase [Candidatus Saccharibacteria bacterium]|nr:HAMP domain-containing histidine kinase [Candidatus Saccharibacteria bacterium]